MSKKLYPERRYDCFEISRNFHKITKLGDGLKPPNVVPSMYILCHSIKTKQSSIKVIISPESLKNGDFYVLITKLEYLCCFSKFGNNWGNLRFFEGWKCKKSRITPKITIISCIILPEFKDFYNFTKFCAEFFGVRAVYCDFFLKIDLKSENMFFFPVIHVLY